LSPGAHKPSRQNHGHSRKYGHRIPLSLRPPRLSRADLSLSDEELIFPSCCPSADPQNNDKANRVGRDRPHSQGRKRRARESEQSICAARALARYGVAAVHRGQKSMPPIRWVDSGLPEDAIEPKMDSCRRCNGLDLSRGYN
jgi:hypothetical protein